MALDPLNLRIGEACMIAAIQAERAERAVALMAACAAGNLGHFMDMQASPPPPIKFAERREGDMVHVHVEPHADRIRRDEIINLARLEHRDLRIAGTRAERAHHDCCAAAQSAQGFRHRIDFLGTEGDDRRARGQARKFFRAAIGQGREARAGDNVGIGHQRTQHRAQTVRAQDHGLFAPAHMEHAIGEDMAAFRISGELGFVDGDKGSVPIPRHGFRGAEKPARLVGQNLLFAGNQANTLWALGSDHSIIDFPGQQAERKADHSAGMAHHPLDSEMGLAGIGRAEHGSERRTGEIAHLFSIGDAMRARKAHYPEKIAEMRPIERHSRLAASVIPPVSP